MSTTARARRTDPVTSHEAASSVAVNSQAIRVLSVLIMAGHPLTDEEIAAEDARLAAERGLPAASAAGLRSRRAELVRDGFVASAGATGRTATGRRALRWRYVPIEERIKVTRTPL